MDVREEYENLKQELLVRLTDVTPMCSLDLPFGIRVLKEDEDRYLPRGTSARLATKKAFIILENAYKKIRLFPEEDIVDLFQEAFDGILVDWICDVMSAYRNEKRRFGKVNEPEMENYLKKLRDQIVKDIEPYIEELRNLKPEDIKAELKSRDVQTETMNMTNFQYDPNSKDGLF